MSLHCTCCGKPLGKKDIYILPDGSLNTMRKECREVALGLDISDGLKSIEQELLEAGYTVDREVKRCRRLK